MFFLGKSQLFNDVRLDKMIQQFEMILSRVRILDCCMDKLSLEDVNELLFILAVCERDAQFFLKLNLSCAFAVALGQQCFFLAGFIHSVLF